MVAAGHAPDAINTISTGGALKETGRYIEHPSCLLYRTNTQWGKDVTTCAVQQALQLNIMVDFAGHHELLMKVSLQSSRLHQAGPRNMLAMLLNHVGHAQQSPCCMRPFPVKTCAGQPNQPLRGITADLAILS